MFVSLSAWEAIKISGLSKKLEEWDLGLKKVNDSSINDSKIRQRLFWVHKRSLWYGLHRFSKLSKSFTQKWAYRASMDLCTCMFLFGAKLNFALDLKNMQFPDINSFYAMVSRFCLENDC